MQITVNITINIPHIAVDELPGNHLWKKSFERKYFLIEHKEIKI